MRNKIWSEWVRQARVATTDISTSRSSESLPQQDLVIPPESITLTADTKRTGTSFSFSSLV